MAILHSRKPLVKIIVPLSILVVLSSLGGLLDPRTYAKETPSWVSQALAQDWVNLVVLVPTLIISTILLRRGGRTAIYVWLGAMLYSVYTFLIYCFAVHFNALFIVYCWALGFSVYGVIVMLVQLEIGKVQHWHFRTLWQRVAGIYLMAISLMFYALWLSEDIPAIIHSTVPASVIETGGWTNPVHVIDLSMILPGMFIAGVLFLKRKSFGNLFAPALLFFGILMDISIGTIVVYESHTGVVANTQLAIVFAAVAVITLIIFIGVSRNPDLHPAS